MATVKKVSTKSQKKASKAPSKAPSKAVAKKVASRDEILLSTTNLSRHFGGLRAVDNVSFTLKKGELHGLIGSNGAGKTTFVSLLCGRLLPSKGEIQFDGKNIGNMPPYRRVEAGIVYTFQITAIFKKFSLYDNVALPMQKRLQMDKVDISELHHRTMAVLNQVGLAEHADKIAGTLSYGHQRILEIAMGIALEPKLLILDEPTQGLSESEIAHFKSFIKKISKQTTIMLIEHNMNVVMDLAERMTVLNFGEILAQGTPKEISKNQDVQNVYLGRTVKAVKK